MGAVLTGSLAVEESIDAKELAIGTAGLKNVVSWQHSECMCSLCRSARLKRPSLRVEALRWVNMLRTEWGHEPLLELPRGLPKNPADCVLARALPRAWRVPCAQVVLEGGTQLPVPVRVQQFILAFDQGMFPDLIDG